MPPWLYLALLVSLLVALGYQIVRARSLRRVPVYWIVILAGFLLGEATAESLGLHSPTLGELQIIPDLVGAAFGVVVLRAVRA